jgi:hypothetical protein
MSKQIKKIEELKSGYLPLKRGKTYILRILSVYNDLFKSKYKFLPNITISKFGMQTKNLIQNYSELQIAAMLIVFFNWAGMDGNDKFSRDKLIGVTHPYGWFCSTLNQYEAYLRNVLEIKFDEEESVREFVGRNMIELKIN